jgi:hypothetical protein
LPPAISAAEVEREVKLLQDLGLLFEEEGTYMSLVMQVGPSEVGSADPIPGDLAAGGVARPSAVM